MRLATNSCSFVGTQNAPTTSDLYWLRIQTVTWQLLKEGDVASCPERTPRSQTRSRQELLSMALLAADGRPLRLPKGTGRAGGHDSPRGSSADSVERDVHAQEEQRIH